MWRWQMSPTWTANKSTTNSPNLSQIWKRPIVATLGQFLSSAKKRDLSKFALHLIFSKSTNCPSKTSLFCCQWHALFILESLQLVPKSIKMSTEMWIKKSKKTKKTQHFRLWKDGGTCPSNSHNKKGKQGVYMLSLYYNPLWKCVFSSTLYKTMHCLWVHPLSHCRLDFI